MSFHSFKFDQANTANRWNTDNFKRKKTATNNKQHDYALTVFLLSLLCSCCIPRVNEKQDVVNSVEAVLICDSSMTRSASSSVETAASFAKVTKWRTGLFFSSLILQTSASGQMLINAVDIIQLTEVWCGEDSRTQGQLSRQYVHNPPEEKQGR